MSAPRPRGRTRETEIRRPFLCWLRGEVRVCPEDSRKGAQEYPRRAWFRECYGPSRRASRTHYSFAGRFLNVCREFRTYPRTFPAASPFRKGLPGGGWRFLPSACHEGQRRLRVDGRREYWAKRR